jgi:DNA-binding MarR family transcriptional regulator
MGVKSDIRHLKGISHLVVCIGRLQAIRTDQLMEKFGLYRGQAILLMILSHHDGLMHSEISDKLGISPAAATKVIKRMEALHYLQRRPDPADERVSRVFLEPEGRAVTQKIQQVFGQIDRVMLAGFSPDEEKMLHALLVKVRANLSPGASEPSG